MTSRKNSTNSVRMVGVGSNKPVTTGNVPVVTGLLLYVGLLNVVWRLWRQTYLKSIACEH